MPLLSALPAILAGNQSVIRVYRGATLLWDRTLDGLPSYVDGFIQGDATKPATARFNVNPSTGSTALVQSNKLALVLGAQGNWSDNIYVAVRAPQSVTQSIRLTFTPDTVNEGYFQVFAANASDDGVLRDYTGYRAEINQTGTITLARRQEGGVTTIGSAQIGGWASGASFTLLLEVKAGSVAVTVWPAGGAQPGTPTITGAPTSGAGAGIAGFGLAGAQAAIALTWLVDDVTVTPATLTTARQLMPTTDLTNWHLVQTEDFNTYAPLGQFAAVYGATMAGYVNAVDTSTVGAYDPAKTLSVKNSILDVAMHTEGGQVYVGAPMIGGWTGTKCGRYAVRFRVQNPTPFYKIAFLLWPDSKQWTDGEIDFPEANLDGYVTASAHEVSSTPQNADYFTTTSTMDNWHVAVTEWTPTQVKFILDGVTVGTSTGIHVPQVPMHWVLQCETNLDGNAVPADVVTHVQVDWVARWAYTGPVPAAQPRLTMSSTGMVQRSGVNYRTGGADIFQLVLNDYNGPRLMTHAEIDSLLDKAVTLKAGVIRAHTLGVNVGPNAYNLVTGVTGTGSTPTISYNAAVWEVMDYAVYAASQRGLYLMVPMTDELGYYHGGKRTWVNFRRPGTCSTDMNVKSSNSSDERAAEGYYYTDTQIVADRRQYLTDWLNHVNQYTGRAYKDEPAIAVIESGNELWTSAQDAPSWAAADAVFVKSIAPSVLYADGAAADGQALNATSLASAAVDIVGTHPYTTFGPSDVTAMAAQAAGSKKAFHVGEYGWSKTAAADIEAAVRATGNIFFSGFWSLQNDADLHNNGAAYGGDDVSLYVPGKDATQTSAVSRLQSHSQAMQDGAATAVPPAGPASSDSFTGTNGAALNSTNWATLTQNASTATIQSNAARLSAGAAGGYGDKVTVVSRLAAKADATVAFTLTPVDASKEFYFEAALRAQTTDSSVADTSAYRLEISNTGGASLARRSNGASTGLGSGFTIAGWGTGVLVHVEFAAIGSTISVLAWTGSTRPATANISVTDTGITAAGVTALQLNGGNAATTAAVTVDDWSRT